MGKIIENPRNFTSFCQQPSDKYVRVLEECGGDPRVVEGQRAINRMKRHGWQPAWDARLVMIENLRGH